MKYNRSEIMKAAWRNYRRYSVSFSEALRMAWYEAKKAAARYNVYGKRMPKASATSRMVNVIRSMGTPIRTLAQARE